jgi:hypothetical protein
MVINVSTSINIGEHLQGIAGQEDFASDRQGIIRVKQFLCYYGSRHTGNPLSTQYARTPIVTESTQNEMHTFLITSDNAPNLIWSLDLDELAEAVQVLAHHGILHIRCPMPSNWH